MEQLIKKGQTIVEVLIAFGLLSLLLPVIITAFVSNGTGRVQQEQRLTATGYLEEGVEAIRSIRDASWGNITVNGDYHPVVSGSAWTLVPGPETLGDFTRTINISDVSPADAAIKKITTTVSWSNLLPSSVSSTTYLARWKNITTPTTITGTLTQLGHGDWCSPGTPVAVHDLGGNGLAGAVVAGVNRAFVGTGQNASSHPFYNVTIDNSIFPPVISVAANGYFDENGLKANDVFGESHYAYLGTSVNANRQIVILDVSVNPPVKLFTIPKESGGYDTNSVFVSNNILYFTAGSKLFAYDVTNRSNPVAKGTFTLNSTGNKIYVVGNYVYVALGSTSNQLQIVDATNPANLKNPGGGQAVLLKVDSQQAISLFVKSDGTRVYLVTAASAQNNFYIINTTNPASPSVVGAGDTTGTMSPKGITVIDNRAIIVGFGNPRYQVWKVDNDLYVNCAKASEPDDIYNVSSEHVADRAYSYIVTANSSSAFEIIEGGPGGIGGGGGTFESNVLDCRNFSQPCTSEVNWNRFTISDIEPPNMVGSYQIATSHDCSTFNYVGPDGSGASSFGVTGGAIPPSVNPGWCFRVKGSFVGGAPTDTTVSSTLLVNYSP